MDAVGPATRMIMRAFPHHEISNIVECAVMQLDHGQGDDGKKLYFAFNTTAFKLGQGPKGETVLSLIVGQTGHINFILPPDLEGLLYDALGRLRH